MFFQVSKEYAETDPDVEKGFDMFVMDSGGGGDEFMAVKPWLGAIVAPTAPPPTVLTPPKVRLDLEWVYGYRGFDARKPPPFFLVCGMYIARPSFWHTYQAFSAPNRKLPSDLR